MKAWNKKKCNDCIKKLRILKQRRAVEQYLFLKYQNYPLGKIKYKIRSQRYKYKQDLG